MRQYFGTDGIRGKANTHPLTAEFALRLGQAAADVFLQHAPRSGEWPTVVLGKDTRQSGDMLESAICAGLNSRGIDVRLAGVVPTPAVAMLTRTGKALFGIVVSASHNSFEDNGIKFFGSDGFKLNDALEAEIEQRLSADAPSQTSSIGRTAALDGAAEKYVEFVCRSVGHDANLLRGLKIALDPANGAAFHTSGAILHALGADVASFHDQPNGININECCGCTHPEVIEALVRETGAHAGVSHDGDADRVLLCDENGSVLDGDELMAIAALGMIEAGTLVESTLVATVMSNGGLDEALRSAGGRVVRAGVGDRYVLEEMRRGGFNLGGEQSGHFIFLDHNTTGDGIVSAVQFLRLMQETGKPLSELRRCMTKFPQVQRSVRVSQKPPPSSLVATSLIERITAELDGTGRVFLRYSGTEPLLRILIEGKDEVRIGEWADLLAAAIHEEIGEA